MAADVINDVSSLLNDSPLVCSEPAANSETVNPLTLSVTVPLVPPPLKPVPAVTPSISPASLVKLITPVELL